MKILITTGGFSSIHDNAESCKDWNADQIKTWGTDINESLDNLPDTEPTITYLVPTVLNSANALAYDGANLALRILFKYICRRNRGVSIVLLGFESKEAFLMHYPYPNILKIPGVSYCLFNKYIVAGHEPTQPPLQREQYLAYIRNLGLSLPTTFRSTHSLTNAWSLYKWNSFMEFDHPEDEGKLNLLYFDYIKAIERINNVKARKLNNNQSLLSHISELKRKSSKVLLVDDNVGWHQFFRDLFKNSNIQFEAIGADFKNMSLEEVEPAIHEAVKSFTPEVILLDLRLIEDKDAGSEFRNISGTKILKGLKGSFNAPGGSYGRQILIFTATSRIENILRLKQLNADGFILKEKAEYYTSKEITKDLISQMVCDISTSIDRAKFLIPLNDSITSLNNLFSICGNEAHIKLKEYAIPAIESVRLITQNNELSENILRLVFMTLFEMLEQTKNDKTKLYGHITTLSSELHLDSDTLYLWDLIDDIRNGIAHGDYTLSKGKLRGKTISQPLLLDWISKLCLFMNRFFDLYLK